MEINKRLQIRRDELVNHKHDEDANQDHQRQGHLGEPKAITTLEVLWKPMDYKTYHYENEYVAVVTDDVGDLLQTPAAAHLVYHVLGGVPSGFVGFGRVEVGAAAEEQSREGDEGEGLENGPSVLQPLQGFLSTQNVVNQADDITCEDDGAPHKEQIEHWLRHENA